jgi:uncharacterized membrane protein
MRVNVVALSALVSLSLLSCRTAPHVKYAEQIQPILDQHCVRCHSGDHPSGKIDLTSYTKLMTTRAKISGRQPLIVPGNPSESRLYVLCATSQAHFRMPPDTSGITPLPEEELRTLMRWIQQGANEQ